MDTMLHWMLEHYIVSGFFVVVFGWMFIQDTIRMRRDAFHMQVADRLRELNLDGHPIKNQRSYSVWSLPDDAKQFPDAEKKLRQAADAYRYMLDTAWKAKMPRLFWNKTDVEAYVEAQRQTLVPLRDAFLDAYAYFEEQMKSLSRQIAVGALGDNEGPCLVRLSAHPKHYWQAAAHGVRIELDEDNKIKAIFAPNGKPWKGPWARVKGSQNGVAWWINVVVGASTYHVEREVSTPA